MPLSLPPLDSTSLSVVGRAWRMEGPVTMRNDPTRSASAVSRRTALAGLGAGSLGLLLAARGHSVSAQEATPGVPATPEAATPMATPTAEGQTATINGADLYYVVRGDAAGPPVLLLHGAIGNTEEWHNVSPALVDAGYRVVLMDCRGRGRSTWGDRPITFAQMAADALGLLDLLGIAKTRLVGWSDGGIIGLELAITHPDRLNRAVLYGANFTPDGVYPDGPHPSDQLPPSRSSSPTTSGSRRSLSASRNCWACSPCPTTARTNCGASRYRS